MKDDGFMDRGIGPAWVCGVESIIASLPPRKYFGTIGEGSIMKKYGKRLRTFSDVRRYLGWLSNQVLNGELDAGVASKLGYLANSIVRVLEASEIKLIDARISELEKLQIERRDL
jgi:hypothetical protein